MVVHRLRIAGVDDRGFAAIVGQDRPDVVVAEGAHREDARMRCREEAPGVGWRSGRFEEVTT
jgi:hypothetical protein